MIEIEEKIRNSFKAVKRDIMELKKRYNVLYDINNNLIELKKQVENVQNENIKLREGLDILNKNITSGERLNKEKFKRIRKEVNDISVSAEIRKDFDKLGKKTEKEISFLKDRFVTREDLSELNFKIDKALLTQNYIKKLDANLDILKNKKFNVEDLKSNADKLKTINQKIINNKKKGFLSKKFEEVVDILAEDED